MPPFSQERGDLLWQSQNRGEDPFHGGLSEGRSGLSLHRL